MELLYCSTDGGDWRGGLQAGGPEVLRTGSEVLRTGSDVLRPGLRR